MAAITPDPRYLTADQPVPAGLLPAIPAKLYAGGDSYVSGPGDLDNPTTNRFSSRLAALMRAEETNVAVGGSAVVDGAGSTGPDNSSGGWATYSSSLFTTLTARQAPVPGGKLLTPLGAVLLGWGINDVALLGIPQFDVSYPAAMAALADLTRAGIAFDNQDPSVTYPSGNWDNDNIGEGACFSGTIQYTATNGATLKLAVPAYYNGQAISAAFLASLGTAYTATATVGAQPVGSLVTDGIGYKDSASVLCRLRIPASVLEPGAQTIQIALTDFNGVGNMFFEWWSIEADVPPAIFLQGQPRLPPGGYAEYDTPAGDPPVAWAGAPVGDAHVAAVNNAQEQLGASYNDGRVVFVATDAAINGSTTAPADPTKFLADELHPNPEGDSIITNEFFAAMQTYYGTRPLEAAYTGGL